METDKVTNRIINSAVGDAKVSFSYFLQTGMDFETAAERGREAGLNRARNELQEYGINAERAELMAEYELYIAELRAAQTKAAEDVHKEFKERKIKEKKERIKEEARKITKQVAKEALAEVDVLKNEAAIISALTKKMKEQGYSFEKKKINTKTELIFTKEKDTDG